MTKSKYLPDAQERFWRAFFHELECLGGSGDADDVADDFATAGENMRNLNYQLKQLCHRNRDGSFATQAERERTLSLVATQLHEQGFRNLSVQGLKPKHVEALVSRWTGEKLSAGTVKNRMAHLRWWAEKLGKANIVARSNDAYGIADRRFVTNVSKAGSLQEGQLARITDTNSRLSLELQAAFGLRPAPGRVDQVQRKFRRSGRHPGVEGFVVQGREGAGDSYPHRRAARFARRGVRPLWQGQPDSRRHDLQGTTRPFQASVQPCRHPRGAWVAPCLCPGPLCGAHRLELPGPGRADEPSIES
jgi:hypothetical protein